MTASKLASTHQDLISASATMDIDWTVTCALVLVRIIKLRYEIGFSQKSLIDENFMLILTTTVTSTIKPCILLCIIDINECAEGTHTCQHDCTNVLGSFNCSCRTGFSLASNGFSCNGKNVDNNVHTCFTHIYKQQTPHAHTHTHKHHMHMHTHTHTTCARTHIHTYNFNSMFFSLSLFFRHW